MKLILILTIIALSFIAIDDLKVSTPRQSEENNPKVSK